MPRLGISACLLGEAVRYDGSHKRDAFLTDVLGPFVEWVPVCPEVELGLGTPRPPIRLTGRPEAPRLVVEQTGEDLTARMQGYARARVHDLERLSLDGYVLKRASPSCGLFGVDVYTSGARPAAAGRGLFAAALTGRLTALPVEEEGRLSNAAIREHFLERVFAAARWRTFLASRPRAGDLLRFHAAHELTLLAHAPKAGAALDRLVAGAGRRGLAATLAAYGRQLMAALAIPVTRGRHGSVLQHAAGIVKPALSAHERRELAGVIRDYRSGRIPLIVPVSLLQQHLRRCDVAPLRDQHYLHPHPGEWPRRNHV